MNNSYGIVDALRRQDWVTATVFVRDGEEYVRVNTTVLDAKGKRGTGTLLSHNAAYAALQKGQQYCGPIDVLGVQYDACYSPVRDAGGKIIGATYVGYKK